MPVYAIQAGENGPVKLGKADDPRARLCELQVGNHLTLRLLRVWNGGTAEETALHERFAALWLRGDWHSFSREMLGDVGLVPIAEPVTPPPPPAPSIVYLGHTLHKLRRSNGMTQLQVAAAAGVARSTIASIEAGHDLPGRDALLALSKLFNVTTEFLCGKRAA